MTLEVDVREQVRQRADFAGEFCGLTETDAGGELTVDHFRPTSREGNDQLDKALVTGTATSLRHPREAYPREGGGRGSRSG